MTFTYTGDDERVYPELGLTVKPGDVVVLDANPDPERFSDGGSVSETQPTPEAPQGDAAPQEAGALSPEAQA